jgi:L-arabinonolactonase
VTGYARFSLLRSDRRDVLGEGPWWSVSDQYLYWVDILGRSVRGSKLDGTGQINIATPSEVGFAVQDEASGIVLALRDGLFHLDALTENFSRLTSADFDPTDHRINDGKTDRSGRLWYGTMHDLEKAPTGGMYSFDRFGERRLKGNITTSNGIGFSPDSKTMYYTDSMAHSITAFDFDLESGTIEHPCVFSSDEGYRPDGLTVDRDGCVWSAKWNGGCVVQYDPEGGIVQTLTFPVSRPTSCMFVGHDLGILAVTSARPNPGIDEPLAGSVFLVEVDAFGLAETPFSG